MTPMAWAMPRRRRRQLLYAASISSYSACSMPCCDLMQGLAANESWFGFSASSHRRKTNLFSLSASLCPPGWGKVSDQQRGVDQKTIRQRHPKNHSLTRWLRGAFVNTPHITPPTLLRKRATFDENNVHRIVSKHFLQRQHLAVRHHLGPKMKSQNISTHDRDLGASIAHRGLAVAVI